jgi:hypothetical protein
MALTLNIQLIWQQYPKYPDTWSAEYKPWEPCQDALRELYDSPGIKILIRLKSIVEYF